MVRAIPSWWYNKDTVTIHMDNQHTICHRTACKGLNKQPFLETVGTYKCVGEARLLFLRLVQRNPSCSLPENTDTWNIEGSSVPSHKKTESPGLPLRHHLPFESGANGKSSQGYKFKNFLLVHISNKGVLDPHPGTNGQSEQVELGRPWDRALS